MDCRSIDSSKPMQCRTTQVKFARPISRESPKRGYEGRGARDGRGDEPGIYSASKSDSRCSWRARTQPKFLERTRLILYSAARQVVDEVEARCVVMYVS